MINITPGFLEWDIFQAKFVQNIYFMFSKLFPKIVPIAIMCKKKI